MANKHTPGPWRVDGKDSTLVVAGSRVLVPIARALPVSNGFAQDAPANAALIASELMLLSELEALVESVEILAGTVEVLRGRGPEDADYDTHEGWAMDDARKRATEARAAIAAARGE
jgi:hypothetical protein